MPAFSYKRILVIFGAFKHHIGFFITPSVRRAFEKELAGYKTASSSVQLPYDKPLPKSLVRKLVAYRVKQERAKDAKWRVKIRSGRKDDRASTADARACARTRGHRRRTRDHSLSNPEWLVFPRDGGAQD